MSNTTATTPSSKSKCKRSTKSPINKVPYDVLLAIFLCCLPRYPLETHQPNTTIAPMLLCHVCKTWRRTAFISPLLWSHLSCRITIYEVEEELGPFAFLQKEIDFVLWWKRKQGTMAPFLRIDGDYGAEFHVPKSRIVAGDGMSFFVDYLTSAQHLRINPLVELILQRTTESGYRLACPHLRTVVSWELPDFGENIESTFYYLPSYAPSLRHLSIHDNFGPDFNTIPPHWHALTHLSLVNITRISFDFWFSLLRGLLNLEWAHIIFNTLDPDEDHIKCSPFIHYQLSTLFVAYKWGEYSERPHFPLSSLFTHIYLPRLRSLSLYSDAMSHSIFDIETVLQSAPAIKSLTIRGYRFLSQYELGYFTDMFATIGAITPVWNQVPRLKQLQLALPTTTKLSEAEMAEKLDDFIRDFFFTNCSWVDLGNSKCPIRTITLIDDERSNPQFERIKEYAMASIQKCAGELLNVTFRVISDEDSEDTSAEDIWREWGSRT